MEGTKITTVLDLSIDSIRAQWPLLKEIRLRVGRYIYIYIYKISSIYTKADPSAQVSCISIRQSLGGLRFSKAKRSNYRFLLETKLCFTPKELIFIKKSLSAYILLKLCNQTVREGPIQASCQRIWDFTNCKWIFSAALIWTIWKEHFQLLSSSQRRFQVLMYLR